MKDCLFAQFKSSVEGDYPVLAEIQIPLVAFEKRRVDIGGNADLSLKIIGNGNFYTSSDYSTSAGQEKTQNQGSVAVYMTAMAGDILCVKSKYKVWKIGSQYASNTPIYKNLDSLNYMSELTTLYFNDEDKPKVNLNKISESCAALATFRNPYNPNVTGNIETIVENMLAGGRNTGTLEMYLYASSVAINGSNSWCQNYDQRAIPLIVTFNSATSVVCTLNSVTLATYSNGSWSY